MKKMKFQKAILGERRGQAERLIPGKEGRQNPRYGALTLNEYRFSYPMSASIPTLTQRGSLGPLLAREQRKALRRARRRAAVEAMLTGAVEAFLWLRRAFSPSASRPIEHTFRSPAPSRV
jgi:hypothetical protein